LRPRLTRLTAPPASPVLRAAAWAALAAADDSFDAAWASASTSTASLADLLNGIPLLNDPQFRARAFDRVKPLVAQPATAAAGAARGGARFVRIDLPRTGTLTLAEVEVFSRGANVAPQGKARQSSTASDGAAERAIDGRTDGSYGSGTQTHTRENETNPWWELDLGGEFPVDAVTVWNRTEGDLGQRLQGFNLTLLDGSRNELFRATRTPAPTPSLRLPVALDGTASLRRAAIGALVSMATQPEATFTELATLIARGDDVAAAAQAIRTLPRDAWPKEQVGPTATALIAWARKVPAAGRTGEDYLQALQTAGDLAGLLPPAQAANARNELRDLRVPVFVIRTVREQMRYDTPRLVVEAGKAFEIIIYNDDFMPHNLVVVKPGAREKIGPISDKMSPEQLDARGRAFIPDSPDILAATRLLESGVRETLQLTAPTVHGEYEYVCTFPGHWPVMWGRLIVTHDVDAYLREHPVAEIPKPTQGHGHFE
jgi:azurin